MINSGVKIQVLFFSSLSCFIFFKILKGEKMREKEREEGMKRGREKGEKKGEGKKEGRREGSLQGECRLQIRKCID